MEWSMSDPFTALSVQTWELCLSPAYCAATSAFIDTLEGKEHVGIELFTGIPFPTQQHAILHKEHQEDQKD